MKETIKDIKKNIVGALGSNEGDGYKAAPIPQELKKNKMVAIITDNDMEDTEFFYPYYRFNEAGYDVDVITIEGGKFEGKRGLGLKESKSIDQVGARDYEALYLPGGKAPQKLRENEKVLRFVREIASNGKIIAAVCHGPQILISAGLVKDKKLSGSPKIKKELEEAGAIYVDEALQEYGRIITARRPGDLHRHMYGVLEILKKK